MDQHRRPPPKEALSDERARSIVLDEVLRLEEAKLETQVWEPQRETTRGRAIVAGTLFVLAIWVWVFPPAPLSLAPPSPYVETDVKVRAGLRMAIGLQVDRIEAFRAEHGRLPDQLEEAGEPVYDMTYSRSDDNARDFQLQARAGGQVERFASGDSLAVFMTAALRAFRNDDE